MRAFVTGFLRYTTGTGSGIEPVRRVFVSSFFERAWPGHEHAAAELAVIAEVQFGFGVLAFVLVRIS